MKLSVSMITYNHEPYIAEAIESALMQRTDFDFEIVVGEDCSTDATRAILADYQRRFPDRIRLLLPEQNLGVIKNFMTTIDACRGEYIALLEGDDFWTSPDKLRKQVAYLDAHPECCASFHNVLIADQEAPEKNRLFHEKPLGKEIFTLRDIVSNHFIPTCSTVFRAKLFDSFPEWFTQMPMGDWPLHVLNAEHGTHAYLDEVLATYRVHGGGVWSGKSRLKILDNTIQACRLIRRHLQPRHPRRITKSIRSLTSTFEMEAFEILKAQKSFGPAALHLLRALAVCPRSSRRVWLGVKELLHEYRHRE
jgi:glycosyltransferase involved in cell wall biosynthesis